MSSAQELSKTIRSSHQRCSVRKSVLRNFTKFTGEHLCQSLFYNNFIKKLSCNFIKKETLAQVLSCEFVKFLRAPFLQNISGWLFLNNDAVVGINYIEWNLTFGFLEWIVTQ